MQQVEVVAWFAGRTLSLVGRESVEIACMRGQTGVASMRSSFTSAPTRL